MASALTQFYSAISSVVGGFFNLQIVSGVSFGWFIIGVAIFTLIINYLFRKVVV